jgi:hypothetical protein
MAVLGLVRAAGPASEETLACADCDTDTVRVVKVARITPG